MVCSCAQEAQDVHGRLSARLVTLFRHQAAAVKDGTALAVLGALVRVKLRRQSEGELATRRQARARARARARRQARARERVGRRCADGELNTCLRADHGDRVRGLAEDRVHDPPPVSHARQAGQSPCAPRGEGAHAGQQDGGRARGVAPCRLRRGHGGGGCGRVSGEVRRGRGGGAEGRGGVRRGAEGCGPR
jgi:hypothetical protein